MASTRASMSPEGTAAMLIVMDEFCNTSDIR